METEFKITLPEDFENALNRILLITGAGFTKNFGGLLACEMWPYIFNNLSTSDTIKNVMKKNGGNYEEILNHIAQSDIDNYYSIVQNCFKLMDENILKEGKIKHIEKFINLFIKQDKYNFIFSTNQDLLIERYFMSITTNRETREGEQSSHGQIANEVPLSLPYLNFDLTEIARSTSNQCVQSSQSQFYPFDKFNKTVGYVAKKHPVKGVMNYVKLHGSFNWSHSEGYIVNITGTNKFKDAEKSKIFKMGFALIDEIIKFKNIIVLVGYGFNDAHINDRLIESAKNQSSLVVMSSEKWSDFRERTLPFGLDGENNKQNMASLLGAIDRYYECSFSELIDTSKKISEYRFENFKAYLNSK